MEDYGFDLSVTGWVPVFVNTDSNGRSGSERTEELPLFNDTHTAAADNARWLRLFGELVRM
jgi:hypothetical protein